MNRPASESNRTGHGYRILNGFAIRGELRLPEPANGLFVMHTLGMAGLIANPFASWHARRATRPESQVPER